MNRKTTRWSGVCFSVLFGAVLFKNTSAYSEDLTTIPPAESLLPASVLQLDSRKPGVDPLTYANIQWPQSKIIEGKSIANRAAHRAEIDRTWYWLQKIIWSQYLPEEVKGRLLLMPGMRNGDDWVIVRYALKGIKMQIIDGRSLTLVIKPLHPEKYKRADTKARFGPSPDELDIESKAVQPEPGSASEKQTENVKSFVNALFRDVFYFDYILEAEQIPTQVAETQSDGTGAYFGKIHVERPKGVTGWLRNPNIAWWSNGITAVFDIEKVLLPAPSIVPQWRDAELYVGGISHQDKRPFKRFASRGKISFQEEFKKRFPTRTQTAGDKDNEHQPELKSPQSRDKR